MATTLTVYDLKRLLAKGENRLAILQKRRAKLLAMIAGVYAELDEITGGKSGRSGRKPGPKPGRREHRAKAETKAEAAPRRRGLKATKKASSAKGTSFADLIVDAQGYATSLLRCGHNQFGDREITMLRYQCRHR